MKNSLTCFFLLYSISICYGQINKHDWLVQIGGSGSDKINDIVLDDSSNIYVTGYFEDVVDFHPGSTIVNFTSIDSRDLFVSKFDSVGNLIWTVHSGSSTGGSLKHNFSEGRSIARGDSGFIYVTGRFIGIVDFDPGPGVVQNSSNGKDDIFISKYNTSGSLVWNKTIGGIGHDQGNSISIDDSGYVYVTGVFSDSCDFDTKSSVSNHTSIGKTDIFIVKLKNNGDHVWSKTIGGLLDDHGNGIDADNTGNIYLTGSFRDSADFDPDTGIEKLYSFNSPAVSGAPHPDSMNVEGFVLKLKKNGSFNWVTSEIGSIYFISTGTDIEVANSGNISVSGFEKGFTINDHNGNPWYYDEFIANATIKNTNGQTMINFRGGAAGYKPNAISTKSDGDVITTGINYEDNVVISRAHYINSANNIFYSNHMTGIGLDEGTSIALDKFEKIYAVGYFFEDMKTNFWASNKTLHSNGKEDMYIIKKENTDIIPGIAIKGNGTRIRIHPNPTSGVLTIKLDMIYEQVIIKTTDITGRLVVQSISYSTDLIEHEITGNAGLYFVEVKLNNRQREIIKIIKN